MKKLLILMLSTLLLLSGANPVSALVTYSPASDFSITAYGAVTYCGHSDTVYIPPEIYGVKVTTIAYRAFYNQNVTKVVVPETVTRIEDEAFSCCVNLKDLELPMNLEYVGSEVIYLSGIDTAFKEAKKEGYLQLGSCIFQSYYDTSTAEKMLKETKVKIGDDITVIATGAFHHDKCLSFDLPKTIKYIGASAFSNRFLKTRKVVDNVGYEDKYGLYSNMEVDIGDGFISYYSEDVEIKPGTELTPAYFFSDNRTLKTLEIPKSMTEIPIGMCYSARNLVEVDWHDEIEVINENAFCMTKLGNIILPANLKKIGKSAFNSANLKTVVMFDSVEEIGDSAFQSNFNLTDIYYTGSKEQWDAIKKNTPRIPSSTVIHYNYNPALDGLPVLPENINEVTLTGGGTAVGRFFVRDLRGVPAKNCGVKYTVDGKNAKYVFTDDEGFLQVEVENISESKNFEIEITSLVTLPVKELLKVTVLPATFKSSYKAVTKQGASLGLSAGVGATLGPVELKASMLEIGVEGSVANGITFEQEYKGGKNKVSLTTKTDAAGALKAKVGLFADAELGKGLKFTGTAFEANGKAKLGVSAGATTSIDDFDINNKDDVNEISTALLASVLESCGSNLITRELASKLDVNVESYEIGNTVVLDGGASVGLLGIKDDEAAGEVTLYGVNGKAAWENTTTLSTDGSSEYETNFTKSSGDKVIDFEIKLKGDGELKGGSSFKATEKCANDLTLKAVHNEFGHLQELSFTAKESEENGVLWGVDTKETGYTVKYTDNAGAISTLDTYLSSFSRGNSAFLSTSQWQNVSDIMLNNAQRAEYKTSSTTKKGFDIDLGIGGEAGVKIGGSFGLSGVESLSYDVENGFIENGDIYIQGYNSVSYDLDKRITIEQIVDASADIIENMLTDLFDVVTEVIEEKLEVLDATLAPIGDSIKGKVAKITTPKKLQRRNILLLSDEDQSFSTSSAVTTVGNPYIIEITDNGESIDEIEAELILAYTEDMLSDISEDDLAIVRWDDKKCVYTKVESEVDAQSNTVSAIITKPGQYVLSADTLPPAITQLYVNGNSSSKPEIFAVIADVSGIEDFELKLNDETVIDINNFDKYYDYSTGIFRYTLDDYEDDYYLAEIYAKDTMQNYTTEYADVYVYSYCITPESVIVPENVVNGSEFIITGEDLYSADSVYLCAEATDKNGKKYSRSFLANLTQDGFVANIEGIPAGVTAKVWAEAYIYNGNCGKTEKINVYMQPVEIVLDEVLKGCVVVKCNNPSGLENTAKIYATVYDKDGLMIGMQLTDACEEIMFTKLPDGATVKAFLWEGIKPLCKSVTEKL